MNDKTLLYYDDVTHRSYFIQAVSTAIIVRYEILSLHAPGEPLTANR